MKIIANVINTYKWLPEGTREHGVVLAIAENSAMLRRVSGSVSVGRFDIFGDEQDVPALAEGDALMVSEDGDVRVFTREERVADARERLECAMRGIPVRVCVEDEESVVMCVDGVEYRHPYRYIMGDSRFTEFYAPDEAMDYIRGWQEWEDGEVDTSDADDRWEDWEEG